MMKASAKTTRDEKLVERVRKALDRIPGVTEKRMFGSLAFLVRGRLCVTVRAARIMCRIDPVLHDAATTRKGCRTVIMGGRQYRGYVHVDSEAVRAASALKYWIKLALDYNRAQNKNVRRKKRYSF
jgi:TfoX/Sxy family transcriptional regulator of competence genes